MDPKVGKLWEQAVIETLGPRFKSDNYKDIQKAFKDELANRIAKKGPGSNRAKGTGINYARETYKAVRAKFGKLAEAKGISLKGLQVHHTFDELAKNPAQALETTNLSFRSGHAGTKGSGHNFAHEVNEAQAAGAKNPGKQALDKLRAQGINPDVPELAATIDSPSSSPDKAPPVDVAPDKAPPVDVKKPPAVDVKPTKVVKAGEQALETGGKTILKKLGTKALKVIPFVGIGSGLYSAEAEASQGNYGNATLDAVGLVPVVGDVVDAARLGVAVGEVGSELLGIEDVAAEHGGAAESAAKYVGLGEDASRIVGATGAALSSITIAPSIALNRKVMGWFK
jgi:hypothetical protein